MGEVDPAFIQAREHRPKLEVTEAEGIPLIDLAILNSDPPPNPEALKALASEIGEACKTWGFFQVINHGVPLERRRRMEAAYKEFFDLPMEEKRKVRRDEVNPLGYYDTELTKNVRDWKEVYDFTLPNPSLMPASDDPDDTEVKVLVNQVPDYPPDMGEICQGYGDDLTKLAFKVLELIALSLDLPANRFDGFFKDHNTFIRLNHYPPCPVPHLALGLGRHKDAGAMVVLGQDDVGGLDVRRKSDGEWIRVKPTPNAYIINIGNIVEVWSNRIYESLEHRVMVNPTRERFTTGLSFNPSHYVMVEPLEELINEENPAKYKPYNWGKFFASRKITNYKKLDAENIQVDDFKIAN